jgi:hypothetical protein
MVRTPVHSDDVRRNCVIRSRVQYSPVDSSAFQEAWPVLRGAFLINDTRQVLFMFGRVDRYLAEGHPPRSKNRLTVVNSDLGASLVAGIQQAMVTDTGSGIPEESLSKIFEEYRQPDNAARGSSHGLGLSTVSRLADVSWSPRQRPFGTRERLYCHA